MTAGSWNSKLLLALVLGLSGLAGSCDLRPKVQRPVAISDIRLCGGADSVIAAVRGFSDRVSLSFHYGTHQADYGTQTTFRLIGENFELVLFNTLQESNYTLRAYDMLEGPGQNPDALRLHAVLSAELSSADALACAQSTPPVDQSVVGAS